MGTPMNQLDRLKNLSPAKRAMLLAALRGETAKETPPERIEARPPGEPAPLSYAQQRLWFLDQLQPGSFVYNISKALRLRGRLDVEALARALTEIVRRHEVLRASFPASGGRPVQRTAEARPVRLPLVDLGRLEVACRERELRRRVIAELRQPFDLARGPVLRASVVRLAAEDHAALFTVHHIVSDAWSSGILVRELAALYAAFSSGRPSPLPELPIQYSDFAHWQRRRLEEGLLEEQLTFWREQLGGDPAPLQLPTDRPRPAEPSSRGAVRGFRLPEASSQGLLALARAERATPFMAVLAAFQALLGRYSGQRQVMVGSPVANRNRAETADLIGFFVNTQVLRGDLDGEPGFRRLLARARQVTLAAADHQDVPFEKLVDVLAPERDLGRTPLFQVMLAFEAVGADAALRLPGLEIESVEVPAATTKFELVLSILEQSGQLGGWLAYSTELFDPTTVIRLLGHFRQLLGVAVAEPDRPVWQLPLLAAGERQQMLVEWSHGSALPAGSPSGDHLLHRLFAEQAARRSEHEALVAGDVRLTYFELAERAADLAHRLRGCGVGPEVMVGLCLERSEELVVGILGILGAGGAYVPLDPSNPAERLAFIAEDAAISVLVSTRAVRDKVALPAATVVWMDGDRAQAPTPSTGWPETPTIAPTSPAYVIYTSGSTGRPKGVVVSHANVARLLRSTEEWFGFDERDVWTLFHSSAFDFSVWELWGALAYGGKLVVVDYWVSRSPAAFHEMLRRERVTVLNQTPSAFRQLIAADAGAGPGEPLALREVIFGGEALELESLRPWMERHGDTGPRLVNMYGITETTVHVTYRPLGLADLGAGLGSRIGRPIPDLEVYVLDRSGLPALPGVAGELCVGGLGVARGYLGRAALTAERFVPDAQATTPGRRLYRSGDLARWRPERDLEYLGRIDHQVKVRGFRIELGEIESVLAVHPSVSEVVVVARGTGSHQQLVAYLVATPEPMAGELREFLTQRLPDYMVPAAFVHLNALPLTPNGKVDRRALPAPEARPAAGESFVAPRTAAEEILAAAWREVLSVDQVGIDDNFFALGGDSILSIQIIARVGQQGLRITPKQVFQHQTIAELAEVAGGAPAADAEQGPVIGELPLTPIQAWFFDRRLPDVHHANQAFLFELRQPLDPGHLAASLGQLILHHDALRLRFQHRGEAWSQRIAPPSEELPWLHLDLSSLPEARRGAVIAGVARTVQSSLDLENGPLVRLAFFELGAGEPARLLFVVHHLAVDGVSWRILLDDLAAGYRQLAAGEAPRLPHKTTSFKAWARRLADYAGGEASSSELDHWRRVVGLDAGLVPRDLEAGENTVASSRTVWVSLETDETEALLRQVPNAYRARIDETLLTAVVEGFAEWTGSRKLRVDLEGHGREDLFEDVDLSRTVGWFTSIYPVLLDLEGTEGAARALKTIKEQIRAVPGRGVGYGLCRFLLKDPELVARTGAEISFNYLGQLDQAVAEDVPFVVARESKGPANSPRQPRSHLLEIGGRIAGGQLQLGFTYSEAVHRRATIERLAERCREALRGLIAHCTSPGAWGWTPSDFPLAGIDQQALDLLVADDRETEDLYPLSPLQEGLLFHILEAPEATSYRQQLTCVFQGRIDAEAFRQGWQQVFDRHPVLRTTFHWEDLDRPLQRVRRQVEAPLIVLDWQHLAVARQQELFADFQRQDHRLGFDLENGPLTRLALIRTSPDTLHFVWSFSHILWDGWSFPILISEAFACYESQVSGRPPRFERRRPYRDYIAWLDEQDPRQAEAYWRQQLSGFSSPNAIAAALHTPSHAAAGAARSDELKILLSEPTTGALESLARSHQLTLNSVVQGAWALLLSRISGASDVVFGAVVSGRAVPVPGIESMIGLFINTLPVRVAVPESETLVPWLRQMQAEQAEARQLEFSSLSAVQRWSDVPPGQPMFESIMAFENYPVDASMRQQGGSSLRITDVHFVESTNYPLALTAGPGLRLSLKLLFNRAVADPSAVARWLGQLRALFDAIAEDHDRGLSQLPHLTAAERQQLVAEWNDTAGPYSDEVLMHQLFERQVEETPGAVAVVDAAGEQTYRQLNARANRLAHLLVSRGVGRDTMVGIHLGRSAQMLVATLGVLKAGGAYVPLDPIFPRARVLWILDALEVGCLLADGERLTRLAGDGGLAELSAETPTLTDVVCLEASEADPALDGQLEANAASGIRVWTAADLERRPEDNPPQRVGSDELAYVIFTSGSTGTPKGVMLRHSPVVNLIEWVNRTFAVGPEDRVLFVTSLSFDLSVYDIFGLLAAGGSVRVASEAELKEPHELVRVLCEEPITYWDSAPAALQQLAGIFPSSPAADSHLRLVFLSGDWVPLGLPDRVRASFPGAEVVALGGATEAAIWSNFHRVRRVAPSWVSIPYGRPITNARYHVLDQNLQPSPVGVSGDLFIAGQCLASGYAREPVLTAGKLLPDPFTDELGAVMYRTGDRARFWPDGTLEFQGRLDAQVKIRGFRVELGEIEALLLQHPAVQEAVALVRQDEPGRQRLVGYLVARDEVEPEPSIGELRDYLGERLPAYMVPSTFVWLPMLPVTSNGKLDRKALPEPGAEGSRSDGGIEVPRNVAERVLAEIWQGLLRVDQIGIHDNFFELGGDSILSLQIISRAGRAGLKVTAAQVFEYPTIAELAAVAGRDGVVTADGGPVRGEVPLTPIQHWYFEPDQADPHHFNMALLMEMDDAPRSDLLARAGELLVQHHDSLRLRFDRNGEGVWRQRYAELDAGSDPGLGATIDLSGLAPASQRPALEDAATRLQASLDLSAGPVWRLAHFRLAPPRPTRLLIVVHHLVCDGVSLRVLLEDLTTAYGQLASGAAVELPSKTSSFQDWSQRLTRHAEGAAMAAELPYWLAGSRQAVELPVDFPGRANSARSQRAVTVELSADDTEVLLQRVPRLYRAQITESLLSCLARGVAGWTGSGRLRVALEGHGREELFEALDVSRTVGWFTAIFPVLLDVSDAADPGTALMAVKEQIRALPGRGVGYGIARYLTAATAEGESLRDLAEPELSFNYLGQLDQGLPEATPFRIARESTGVSQSPRRERRYLLEVDCRVAGGQLRTTWRYSSELHRKATVEGLAESFATALRSLAEHCRSPEAGGFTPSDFPLATLDQPTLDRLLAGARDVEDAYPLSPLQQGLLFHTLQAPESGVYFQQLSCVFEGGLDVDVFERAWREVMDRQPILRTGFAWDGVDQPYQIVYRSLPVPLQLRDWRDLEPEDRDRRLAELLEEDRRRGFDLHQAPLMRLSLLRLDDDSYRLIWSHHHLLLDGWSLPLLFQDLFGSYGALASGQAPDLEHRRGYREFIAWIGDRDAAAAERFWRDALADFTSPTPVVADWQGSAADQAPDAEDRELAFSEETTAALQTLTRRGQVTLNTLIQGVWAWLLSRYSHESDVVFGVVTAGRPPELPGVESMIGLFINTLPARVRVDESAAWVPWLQAVQAWQVEARQYEFCSLTQVHGWSEVPRNESLFDSILLFENYPVGEALGRGAGGGLRVGGFRFTEQTHYPLCVTALPGPRLRLLLSGQGRYFEPVQLERILGHFETALKALAEDSDRLLGELPLLTDAERRQLVDGLSGGGSAAREASSALDGPCVHQMVEAQAERTPDATAVVAGDQHLTYRELDRRAELVAAHLAASGVGPDTGVGPDSVVGLCLERTPELIIGILAIHKAGGAYLPLDPAYPLERLRFMTEDSRLPALVTSTDLVARRPELEGLAPRLVLVDETRIEAAGRWERPAVSATNLAVVLYTSGSTGRPKGVGLQHTAAAAYASNTIEAHALSPEDRVLQFSSISFDASFEEIYPGLARGATLVLRSDEMLTSIPRFLADCQAERISIVTTSTAYWHEITAGLNSETPMPETVRLWIIGGEAALAQRLEEWRRRTLPSTRLFNTYGPTETTVVASRWDLPRAQVGEAPVAPRDVPIGRPISTSSIFLLDSASRLVPETVPGEIYIGGAGLVRGYLRRPALTAERFVPDAWSGQAGGRLYRTGDLARWLPSGELTFVGRVDRQVKIRGFRVEPGEIAAVLVEQPEVRSAAVMARKARTGALRLVAYVVPVEPSLDTALLRRALEQQLPEHMVPSAIVTLDAIPLTSNEKIDYRALPEPEGDRPELGTVFVAPRNEAEHQIAAIWCDLLELDRVGVDDNFFDLGGHSLLLIRLHGRLRERLGDRFSLTDLFRFPTIRALAGHMHQGDVETAAGRETGGRRAALRLEAVRHAETDLAVIGMDCRFPGAGDVEAFWRNLREGVESVRFFTDDELLAAGVSPRLLKDPSYVKAKSVLDDPELFDAAFFGFNPRDAEVLDPQHRLFLECAWNALESAGYDPQGIEEPVGVFAGSSMSTYLFNLYSHPELVGTVGAYQIGLANDKDFLPTRVSYKLDLRGPSLNVNTACSTSLVGVHLACQSLLAGECDMALAGGVSVSVPQTAGYLHQQGGILSPDGHCRAFDAGAGGTLDGNGAGVVVLKRLREALADGDTVHAVIKGSAINNDGSGKVGFTAPSVEGQAAVIAEAQAVAGVEPRTVSYVEAHGTGTALGDPIEIAALHQAFGDTAGTTCAIGSVKTNFGHLDAAAGMAGLIKTVLALEHRQLPPSLHFESSNPEIDFSAGPFRVNERLNDWASDGGPRRAGVSSFGVGGTNAHVVLEEAPPSGASDPAWDWQTLVVSARSEAALATAQENLARHLENHPELDLADVAYTLKTGRRTFAHRSMLVCRDRDDAVGVLRGSDPSRLITRAGEERDRPVVFLFPGQGTQHPGMGAQLYRAEPAFRHRVDRCAELLEPHLGCDLRARLFPPESADEETLAEAAERLRQTDMAQPAVFTLEASLAELWRDWGVEPEAFVGHSIGEYVAAYLAGVFSLEDALRLVAVRGRLIQGTPKGAMLSVSLPSAEVEPLLGADLSLAAVNAPRMTVISGTPSAISALEDKLTRRQVGCRRLHTSHAFHSPLLRPIADAFAAEVAAVERRAPRIPWISNVTGTWIESSQATDPRYWAEHLLLPVQLSAAVRELLTEPRRLFLEVGPGRVLGTLVRQQAGADTEIVSSLAPAGDPRDDTAVVSEAAGRLWLAGGTVDWRAMAGGARRRVPLPTYPFERRRFWVERAGLGTGQASGWARAGKRPDLADWLYAPSWRRSVTPRRVDQRAFAEPGGPWLVFVDERGVAERLVSRLESAGVDVIEVRFKETFAWLGEGEATVNPQQPESYQQLVAELDRRGVFPSKIVHLGSLRSGPKAGSGELDEAILEGGFYSLYFLAQALAQRPRETALEIAVVTAGAFDVTGEETLVPEAAATLGPCRVFPRELPAVWCRNIDVLLPETGDADRRLIEQLAAELVASDPAPAVALRRDHRWLPTFESLGVAAPPSGSASGVRDGGVVLITGGLGGIGLTLADRLASLGAGKLVLVGRTPLPAPDERARWLAEHDEHDPTSLALRTLRDLEERGVEVETVAADVADRQQMEALRRRVLERFGAVHGIVHAAGVAGSGPMQLGDRERAAAVLAPKAAGARLLAELFGDELDFLVLCSSMDTILGAFGQADYCAANAFLDAFAQAHRRTTGVQTVSIDWDGWSDVGMAAAAHRRLGGDELAAQGLRDAITPSEGAEVFERILYGAVPAQVVVSTQELTGLIQRQAEAASAPKGERKEAASSHERPALASVYAEPRNEIERLVAEIWQGLLGIEKVGIHDDFFELGGHSLLATQVITRLRQELGVGLELRQLFEAPTVARLAEILLEAQLGGDDEDLSEMMAELEMLSDEEAEALLAAGDPALSESDADG